MAHYAPLVLLLLLVVTCVLEAQPDGWAMTDRFYGFRYEMIVNDAEKDVDSANKYIEMIQMEADRRNCFGWVQRPNKLRIVGEVRCAKPKGEDIVQWFRDNYEEGRPSEYVSIKDVYELFISSDFISGLSRAERVKYNRKYFVEYIQSNIFFRKYYADRFNDVRTVIKGWKQKQNIE